MSLPAEVHDVTIKDGLEFDLQGRPVKVQQWSYFVGTHGPFNQKFNAGELQPAHIERVISQHVADLRQLGVLSAPKP
jgi:formylglycine-generating enzyme required for sulfatase activity